MLDIGLSSSHNILQILNNDKCCYKILNLNNQLKIMYVTSIKKKNCNCLINWNIMPDV
jgi:hypothetical protein